MKKIFAGLIVASIFVAFFGFRLNQRHAAPAIEIHYVRFDDNLPDAFDKFDFIADRMVLIYDGTKTKALKGLPSVVLVGDTVTISSKSYFGVVPTKTDGQGVQLTPHAPGEKVKLTADGLYTLLIFRSATDVQPIGLTYIDKTDKEELQKMRERKKEPDSISV